MALKKFYTVSELYNMMVTDSKLREEIEKTKKFLEEHEVEYCWRKTSEKMIEDKQNMIDEHNKVLVKVLDKNNMEETQKRMDLIMHYIITGKDGNEKFYVA